MRRGRREPVSLLPTCALCLPFCRPPPPTVETPVHPRALSDSRLSAFDSRGARGAGLDAFFRNGIRGGSWWVLGATPSGCFRRLGVVGGSNFLELLLFCLRFGNLLVFSIVY